MPGNIRSNLKRISKVQNLLFKRIENLSRGLFRPLTLIGELWKWPKDKSLFSNSKRENSNCKFKRKRKPN